MRKSHNEMEANKSQKRCTTEGGTIVIVTLKQLEDLSSAKLFQTCESPWS